MSTNEVKGGAYKAFEKLHSDWLMTFKMHLHLVAVLAVVQGVLIWLLGWIFISNMDRQMMFSYWASKISRMLFMNPSFTIDLPTGAKSFSASQIVSTPLAQSAAHKTTIILLVFFVLTLSVYYLLIPWTKKLTKKGEELFSREHIRGAKLLTEKQLSDAILATKKMFSILIGSVPWLRIFECEHLAIFGKTRVGKTVIMFQILEKIRNANAKAAVLDVKNDYLEKWYDPAQGDLLFNVLDERCVGWNIFNELETLMDVDSIAATIIPDAKGGGSNEQFFNDAARAVLVGGIHVCIQKNTKTTKALRDIIFQNTELLLECIENVKAGKRGAQFIQQPASALAGSVIAVLTQYCSWLDYMSDKDGDFSFIKWLTDSKPGFLIISSNDKIEKILRPVISLAFDLIARQVNSLPDNRDNRIYLLMDEFGTLQRLSAIVALLTKGGGKGLSVTITCQDAAQIEEPYGKNLYKTILNSFGGLMALKLSDSDTAENLSKSFGKQEYWEYSESITMKAAGDAGDGISIQKQKRDEFVATATEIQYLEALEFYLRLPNNFPCKGRLEIKPVNNRPSINKPFIERKGLLLTDIYQRNETIEKIETERTENSVLTDKPEIKTLHDNAETPEQPPPPSARKTRF